VFPPAEIQLNTLAVFHKPLANFQLHVTSHLQKSDTHHPSKSHRHFELLRKPNRSPYPPSPQLGSSTSPAKTIADSALVRLDTTHTDYALWPDVMFAWRSPVCSLILAKFMMNPRVACRDGDRSVSFGLTASWQFYPRQILRDRLIQHRLFF
jgi:hypothetical protein